MLPRTGNTLMGPFGFSPGIEPAPATEPFCSWPEAETCARTTATVSAAASLARIACSLARRSRLGRRRQRFQRFTVLRIHRFGTASRRLIGNAVVHAEFVEVRIGSRKQVRDHA